jgi:hypothetical protein
MDGRFAADAATGCGEKIAPQGIGIEFRILKLDLYNVTSQPIFRRQNAKTGNLVHRQNDSFGQQESSRQLKIVARRPHCYRKRHAANPNLKRLFGRQGVLQQANPPVFPLRNLRQLHTSLWCAHPGSILSFQLEIEFLKTNIRLAPAALKTPR